MTRLRPHLALDVVETLWSFACRLAAFHIGGSLWRFLGDLGLDPAAIRMGRTDEVLRLAEAAGIAPEALLRATLRSSDGRSYTFRGEPFSHNFVAGSDLRVCPLCLADDEEAHPGLPPDAAWRLRIAWRFRPVTCCPRHEVALVLLARPGKGRDTVEVRRVIDAAGSPRALLAHALPHVPGPLQLWVQARLEDHRDAGGPWLAAQTIEQGARACEMLGAQMLFGGRRNAREGRDLSVGQWEEAGACGLEIAQGGPNAIRSALDDLRARARGAAVQAGGDGVYGMLYSWLDQSSPIVDPGPIRHLVREHMLQYTAVAPGERVLGEPVRERQMHSITSLSETLGLPQSDVVRRLVRVGWMAPDLGPVAAGRLAFPAMEAERKCAAIVTCVVPQIAARLLGCSGEQLESLAKAGVIEPILDHGPTGRTCTTKYSSEEVIGLLTRLRTMSVRVQDTAGMVELEEAAERTGLSFGELVARSLESQVGRLSWSRLRTGLSAVRLRQADLAKVCPPGSPDEKGELVPPADARMI